MDILKTFEIFLSAPISMIKKRKIKIMHLETDMLIPDIPISLEMDEDIELTVYNNPKVYNLLSSVIKKRRLKDENKNSEIHNERPFS